MSSCWCPAVGCRALAEWEALGDEDAVVLCGAGHWFELEVTLLVLLPE